MRTNTANFYSAATTYRTARKLARIERREMLLAKEKVERRFMVEYMKVSREDFPVPTPTEPRAALMVQEALPDFGPWAVAYCGETGAVIESPMYEAYSFIKVPGVRTRRLFCINYRR